MLVRSLMFSCVIGAVKSRPNLRVNLGFSVCPLSCFILFGTGSPFTAKSVLEYLKLLVMSNEGRRTEKK